MASGEAYDYSIEWIDDAVTDLDNLGGVDVRLVLGSVRVLKSNPEAGRVLLGATGDEGFNRYRVLDVDGDLKAVYHVEHPEPGVRPPRGTCTVWLVLRAGDQRCLSEALERLQQEDTPVARTLEEVLTALETPQRQRLLRIRTDQPPEYRV